MIRFVLIECIETGDRVPNIRSCETNNYEIMYDVDTIVRLAEALIYKERINSFEYLCIQKYADDGDNIIINASHSLYNGSALYVIE